MRTEQTLTTAEIREARALVGRIDPGSHGPKDSAIISLATRVGVLEQQVALARAARDKLSAALRWTTESTHQRYHADALDSCRTTLCTISKQALREAS